MDKGGNGSKRHRTDEPDHNSSSSSPTDTPIRDTKRSKNGVTGTANHKKLSQVDDNHSRDTEYESAEETTSNGIKSSNESLEEDNDKYPARTTANAAASATMSLGPRRTTRNSKLSLGKQRSDKTNGNKEGKGKQKGKEQEAPEDAYGTRIGADRWLGTMTDASGGVVFESDTDHAHNVPNIIDTLLFDFSFCVLVHQITEDYVDFVGRMMYPGTQFRPYGYDPEIRSYPLEGISALGFLKSPLRRPTVVERWSPYEVALFEAALLHHGKEFHLVAKEVGSKTTKEVIEFYYMWKKTAHHKKWKETYISDEDLPELEVPTKPQRRR